MIDWISRILKKLRGLKLTFPTINNQTFKNSKIGGVRPEILSYKITKCPGLALIIAFL